MYEVDRSNLPTILFQREKLVTTRKPHPCAACPVTIQPGTPCYYIVQMTDWDDKPYTVYEHYSCHWGY